MVAVTWSRIRPGGQNHTAWHAFPGTVTSSCLHVAVISLQGQVEVFLARATRLRSGPADDTPHHVSAVTLCSPTRLGCNLRISVWTPPNAHYPPPPLPLPLPAGNTPRSTPRFHQPPALPSATSTLRSMRPRGSSCTAGAGLRVLGLDRIDTCIYNSHNNLWGCRVKSLKQHAAQGLLLQGDNGDGAFCMLSC